MCTRKSTQYKTFYETNFQKIEGILEFAEIAKALYHTKSTFHI